MALSNYAVSPLQLEQMTLGQLALYNAKSAMSLSGAIEESERRKAAKAAYVERLLEQGV